jgi:bacterioferritin-associated ferredoxin
MYVCSCRAITDRTVDAAIAAGADTVDDVTARCGAGAKCGGCTPMLEQLLAEHAEREAFATVSAVA